mgnify:CR=1 FL=1|jgi:hypothetical protein
MGSSSKRRQTMAKMARERTLQERRELKQQKKDEKKQAAAAARDADADADSKLATDTVEDETAPIEP